MSTHEIEIEYGERFTDFVMGMYVDTSLADDMVMLGWNLCGCDDAVFNKKVGNCFIISDVIDNKTAALKLDFPGKDESLQMQVVDEFLDNWGDLVQHQSYGLLSRA